ncbi:MAG: GAF domain-containing sensor histidine kinase [Armatimonadia bacterium]
MADEPCDKVEELQARLAQRDRQLASIHSITAALRTVTKLNDLVKEALRVSLECVGAKDGSVILFDPDKNKLVFRHVIGAKADDLIGMELEPTQGMAGAVFQSGEIRVSEDVSKEADHARDFEEKLKYQTRNMVTVPLKSPDGRSLGVMQVLNKDKGRFDEGDVEVLDILGGQIAIAIESTRLYEEARLAEVVRFIGNLSHDVKNMITPSQTGAETLQMIADDTYLRLDELLTPEQSPQCPLDEVWTALDDLRVMYPEMLQMVLDGCDAVQQRMVEVSAAVKGIVSEPHFERQQLGTVIDKVIKPLELVGEKSGVKVSYEPQGELPDIDFDDKQMYNAIYNLVNNAVQATPCGGSVTTKTRLSAAGEFAEVGEGPFVVLEVVDTGQGMPPDVKAKAFTDNAVSTKPMGTGLGTKIVKNVMDVHQAKIQVDSEEGKGTTIRCLIPLVHVQEEE